MPGFSGFNRGQRYDDGSGVWGTAEEHAARQKATRQQAPYENAGPSASSVNRASGTVNPNLDYSVASDGSVSASNTSLQGRQTAELQAKLAADAEAKRRQQQTEDRASLLALIQGNASGGGAAPPVVHGGGAGEAAARAAAFSRAKDQAGRIARSSLTSIAEQIAGRGMSGSGIQSLQEAGAIGGAGDELIDVTRDQAMFEANRAANVSDMRYQGDITQRGQDLNARQSYLSLLRSLY